MKKILSLETLIVILVGVAAVGYYLNYMRPVYHYKWHAFTVLTMNDGSVRTNFTDRKNITVSPSEVREVKYIDENQSVKAVISGTTADGYDAKFEFTLYFSFRTEESLKRPVIDDHIFQLRTALIGQMGQYVGKITWSAYKHDGGDIYGMDRQSPDLREAIERLGVHWDGKIKVKPLSGELLKK